ncbi:MAG: PIN domain-containing protein [Acidobacteria bacterium]|nr:PIN domain-containing protein [Acidobacteriota bacterium]
MTTFADTSALYAVLDADDDAHGRAVSFLEVFRRREGPKSLATHGYVVAETAQLVRARLGVSAARSFFDDILPAVRVTHIGKELYERAVAALLASLRRRPSFVDRVSFQLMREEGIEEAFAFDRGFSTEGFRLVP